MENQVTYDDAKLRRSSSTPVVKLTQAQYKELLQRAMKGMEPSSMSQMPQGSRMSMSIPTAMGLGDQPVPQPMNMPVPPAGPGEDPMRNILMQRLMSQGMRGPQPPQSAPMRLQSLKELMGE